MGRTSLHPGGLTLRAVWQDAGQGPGASGAPTLQGPLDSQEHALHAGQASTWVGGWWALAILASLPVWQDGGCGDWVLPFSTNAWGVVCIQMGLGPAEPRLGPHPPPQGHLGVREDG